MNWLKLVGLALMSLTATSFGQTITPNNSSTLDQSVVDASNTLARAQADFNRIIEQQKLAQKQQEEEAKRTAAAEKAKWLEQFKINGVTVAEQVVSKFHQRFKLIYAADGPLPQGAAVPEAVDYALAEVHEGSSGNMELLYSYRNNPNLFMSSFQMTLPNVPGIGKVGISHQVKRAVSGHDYPRVPGQEIADVSIDSPPQDGIDLPTKQVHIKAKLKWDDQSPALDREELLAQISKEKEQVAAAQAHEQWRLAHPDGAEEEDRAEDPDR